MVSRNENSRKMMKAGLRLVQIWVPDTRRKGFAKECRRQSLLVADDAREAENLAWIEDVFDDKGWTP